MISARGDRRAREEDQPGRTDRGQHVDDEQDERADRARRDERRQRRRNVSSDPTAAVRPVTANSTKSRTSIVPTTAAAAPSGVPRGETRASGSARRRRGRGRRRRREAPTAQARAQPKALTEAPRLMRSPSHEPTYCVPRSATARSTSRTPQPLLVGAEAHDLDPGHEDEEEPAEDRRAEDGPWDVAARVPRLLAQRGRGLEAREREEAEDDAEEERRRSGATRHGERGEGEAVAPGGGCRRRAGRGRRA